MHIRSFEDPATGMRADYLVGLAGDGQDAFVLLGTSGLPLLGAQQESETTVRVISPYLSRLADAVTMVGTVAEVLDIIAPHMPPAEEPETPPEEGESPTDDDTSTTDPDGT